MTEITREQLDSLLMKVRRPSRYLGREVNSACKKWDDANVRWALAFPDAYEIGMSHIGLGVIYDILNRESGILADRIFAPWTDMEAAMREADIPLWGLETMHAVRDFDILGITLPYELTYTNILTMLDLAGIPFYASDRGVKYPLIIGGGVGAFNPEPVAPFFDAIVLGDGEDVVLEITRIYKAWKTSAGEKEMLLEQLAKVRGFYVPKLQRQMSNGIQRAIVSDINSARYPVAPVVPFMQVVHDRVGVEIQRGCARGCRFCQAGFIYRPVRQRDPSQVEKLSQDGIRNTGHEELSFLSLSAGDYENLPSVITGVAAACADQWIDISLPSLRVETLTPEVLSVLKRTLHGGFTLAPEAATERLRNVINKGNTEDELLATVDRIFSLGWRQMKLYFMIGLPTETIEDVEAIAALANRAMDIGRKYRRDITITVSVSTFVPKPHTPFQWARQLSLNETLERQDILQRLLRRRGIELRWHDARISFLEGVFSRGDPALAPVIIEAWKNGARFDAWDEQFKFDVWMDAFKKYNIDPARDIVRERLADERLPWDHLFTELDRDFLRREYERALGAEPTPDCVNNKCAKCGVCDFKEVKNNVREGLCALPITGATTEGRPYEHSVGEGLRPLPITLAFTFSKTSSMRWLSHLELMHVFRRAFRRAGLPTRYSQGFHPHMNLSIEKALKVGQEGIAEKGRVELAKPINADEAIIAINRQLPEGIKIISADFIPHLHQASKCSPECQGQQ